MDLKIPVNPHVSPDGSRVVFCVSQPDFEESRWVSSLWLVSLAEHNERRITFSYEGETAPLWSSDGRFIAFLSARPDMTEPPDEEEDEDTGSVDQIWALPTDGGEATRLTKPREGVRDYRWSPDGQRIIYLVDEAYPQPVQTARDVARKRKSDHVVEKEDRRRRQFWEVDLNDRKPHLMYTGDYGIQDFDISPDGSQLVFCSNSTGDPNDYDKFDLFLLNLEDGTVNRLPGDNHPRFSPRWARDGSSVFYSACLIPDLSYSQECLYSVSISDGLSKNLTEAINADVEDYDLSIDGDEIILLMAQGMDGPVYNLSVAGDGSPRRMTGKGCCTEISTVPGSKGLVVVMEDDTTTPELYYLEDNGELRTLTELNSDFLEQNILPRQEIIHWSNDGIELEGVLVWPANGKTDGPLPMITQVHGGPKGRVVNTLRSYYLHPLWAAEGYLVFKPNFRGSEGYGNDFAVSNRRDLGGGDYRDIISGIDSLVANGSADPDKLGIMGGSYGGYMTNWAIGQTDRFKAAISMFGIFSLVADYGNSELSRWEPEYMGAHYWEDPEIYHRCSPSSNLEKIVTPTLIIHGEGDTNTFISNSRELYRALLARGVPVQFVRYPREGHGLQEPVHRLDEIRRSVAWFDRYLRGDGKTPPKYRPEEPVEYEGLQLVVHEVVDSEYVGRSPDEPRLLELVVTITSRNSVEGVLTIPISSVRLRDVDGLEAMPAGVPVESAGVRLLLEGDNLCLHQYPDPESGRIAFALAVAFPISEYGGIYDLLVGDFPPVQIITGIIEREEQNTTDSDEESSGRSNSGSSPVIPAEEGGLHGMQKPDR